MSHRHALSQASSEAMFAHTAGKVHPKNFAVFMRGGYRI